MRELRKITSESAIFGIFRLEHPIVQQVLEIAEQIISENRVLEAKLLYYEAKKRLKIDRKILLSVIQSLLEKKILVEGSKLTKEMVLSNTHRNNIYQYIRGNVGANFSMIREMYKGSTESSGQLIWHLQMLLKFNFIRKVKYKKYTLFLPIDIEEEEGIFHFLLRDDLNMAIIQLLIEEGVVSKSDMHIFFEGSREMLYYRINNLIDARVLALVEGTEKELCLNPSFKEVILKIIESLEGEKN